MAFPRLRDARAPLRRVAPPLRSRLAVLRRLERLSVPRRHATLSGHPHLARVASTSGAGPSRGPAARAPTGLPPGIAGIDAGGREETAARAAGKTDGWRRTTARRSRRGSGRTTGRGGRDAQAHIGEVYGVRRPGIRRWRRKMRLGRGGTDRADFVRRGGGGEERRRASRLCRGP